MKEFWNGDKNDKDGKNKWYSKTWLLIYLKNVFVYFFISVFVSNDLTIYNLKKLKI